MQITSTTPFAGDPEAIWNVLMDFPAYESWNPFVVKADTNDRRRVHLWIDPEAEERMIALEVRIDQTKAPNYLRGALIYGAPALLGGRYDLRIDETARTITQEVKLIGLLRAAYVSESFGRKLRRGLDAMGAKLAQRCAA